MESNLNENIDNNEEFSFSSKNTFYQLFDEHLDIIKSNYQWKLQIDDIYYKKIIEVLEGSKKHFNSRKRSKLTNKFFIQNINDKKLIFYKSNTDNPLLLVKKDEIYSLLGKLHSESAHGGQRELWLHTKKMYGNILQWTTTLFVKACKTCQERTETKKNKISDENDPNISVSTIRSSFVNEQNLDLSDNNETESELSDINNVLNKKSNNKKIKPKPINLNQKIDSDIDFFEKRPKFTIEWKQYKKLSIWIKDIQSKSFKYLMTEEDELQEQNNYNEEFIISSEDNNSDKEDILDFNNELDLENEIISESSKIFINHQKEREEKLKKMREINNNYQKTLKNEMMAKIKPSYKNYKIGDIAKIKISKIDHPSSLSPKFIIVKIMKIKNNSYQVECSFGILKNYYKSNDLEKVNGKEFSNLLHIPTTKILLRSAAKQLNTKLKNLQEQKECSCKSMCINKKCTCKKKNLLCIKKCHLGKNCNNK
ncbi:12511_t:CDS:2 [Cetraspora pellucida]|uniref:12511_t:CDS:1 n=1 Tax=Cetraspora pellucida TaxID=1433469 RepID=A0ACA9JZJ1_9GLOM|nr:12511_t:CDS:2 [Cetraspora pellucida]